MKRGAQSYVGQLVHLVEPTFARIRDQAAQHGTFVDNAFLVAQANRKQNKLVCYGSTLRILVDVEEVRLQSGDTN